jgi:hypothetical protein
MVLAVHQRTAVLVAVLLLLLAPAMMPVMPPPPPLLAALALFLRRRFETAARRMRSLRWLRCALALPLDPPAVVVASTADGALRTHRPPSRSGPSC